MRSNKTPRIAAALLAILICTGTALAVSDEAFQLNEEGITLFEQGKYAKAKERFLEAITADSVYSEARVNAARAAEKLDDWETVKFQYLTVLTYEEENVDALTGAGNYMVKASQYPEAEGYLKKATGFDPRNVSAFYGLGNLYYKMKKYGSAKTNYKKVISLDPRGYSRAWLRVGLIEFDGAKKTKKYAEATKHLEKYLELDPDGSGAALAHYRLGFIHYQGGKTKAALEQFAESKKLSPKDHLPCFYSGEIHLKAGNRAAAEKEYLECLKRKPGFGLAHFKLAIMYQQDYRDEDALTHYKAAAADKSFKQRSQAAQQAAALEEYFRKVKEAETED